MNITRTLALLAAAAPAFAQYGGPAILTRGEAPAGMSAPQVSFRPFLEATGVYDTGLSGVSVNSKGDLANEASMGTTLSGGISGSHRWRRTLLGVDLRASMNHYTRKTYYDGGDQSLMIGITHQLTRRSSITLSESAGMNSRNFSSFGLSQAIPFDPSSTFAPTTDFYDNRTMYLSSQARFIYQQSARLSYSVGGGYFLTRRRSSALYGVKGASAQGDLQYRLSRRSTVGLAYSFTNYTFKGAEADSNVHSVVATYAVALSRRVELSASAGVGQLHTQFLRAVAIDPAVAAIIGIHTAPVVDPQNHTMPNVSARLSRSFHNGVFYLGGGYGATPGNGLFLTSKMLSASTGYTYTGLRRWSFGASSSYNRSQSVGNVNGDYGSTSGDLNVSRRITGALHAVAGFSARQYQSNDFDRYNRLIYSARIGIGWTPGEVPLRIW